MSKPFRNIKHSNVVRVHVCMTDAHGILKDTTISIDTTLYAICKLLDISIVSFCKQKSSLIYWDSPLIKNMSLSKYLQQELMKEIAIENLNLDRNELTQLIDSLQK